MLSGRLIHEHEYDDEDGDDESTGEGDDGHFESECG